MDERTLLENLQQQGRLTAEQVRSWRDSAASLAILDAIGRDGTSALVKIDGGRQGGAVYTVVVSGGQLGEISFRKDGANLEALLQDAISFYLTNVWKT